MATKLGKPVVRETALSVFECGRERPVMVELQPRVMRIWLKGSRQVHELTYDGLWWRSVGIEVEKGRAK